MVSACLVLFTSPHTDLTLTDDFWWFLATSDGCKVYVRLSKHQFPPPDQDNEPPFRRNPERYNQYDPCYQNPSGAFTIWIDPISTITLCPDSFQRFPSDRPDLTLPEIPSELTIYRGTSPANQAQPDDPEITKLSPKAGLEDHTLEDTAVNALTWYRELFRLAGRVPGSSINEVTYIPRTVAKPEAAAHVDL